MKFRIVELVALVMVVGALALLGVKAITFEQAIMLITIAVSLLTGKYVSRYEGQAIQRIRPFCVSSRGVITALALTGLVIGIFLFWGGEWLIWDWINSIVNGSWIDWDMFCREWCFYAPLFLYKWTCETWTGPFDLGKMWIDLGGFLMIASAFILGYMARPVIEAFIKRSRR
jgi:hypothetical protein